MASYLLKIYLLAGNVIGLPAGVYHYMLHGHDPIAVVHGNRINELFSSFLWTFRPRRSLGLGSTYTA